MSRQFPLNKIMKNDFAMYIYDTVIRHLGESRLALIIHASHGKRVAWIEKEFAYAVAIAAAADHDYTRHAMEIAKQSWFCRMVTIRPRVNLFPPCRSRFN